MDKKLKQLRMKRLFIINKNIEHCQKEITKYEREKIQLLSDHPELIPFMDKTEHGKEEKMAMVTGKIEKILQKKTKKEEEMKELEVQVKELADLIEKEPENDDAKTDKNLLEMQVNQLKEEIEELDKKLAKEQRKLNKLLG